MELTEVQEGQLNPASHQALEQADLPELDLLNTTLDPYGCGV